MENTQRQTVCTDCVYSDRQESPPPAVLCLIGPSKADRDSDCRQRHVRQHGRQGSLVFAPFAWRRLGKTPTQRGEVPCGRPQGWFCVSLTYSTTILLHVALLDTRETAMLVYALPTNSHQSRYPALHLSKLIDQCSKEICAAIGCTFSCVIACNVHAEARSCSRRGARQLQPLWSAG